MKILIAEDNATDRLILKKLVEQQGHEVVEAKNGKEAIEKYSSELPGIVLLDVIMPEADGFEVAKFIKLNYDALYTPIIFITSLTETEFLVKCIESGGDDFFTKPFNRIVLQAKIDAFIRAKNLYQTVVKQKQEIELYSEHLVQEQRVAKQIFDNVAHKGALEEAYISYSVSALSIFNGDILLAAKRPLGGVNVLLGDFTGHGLPASIGALPVSDIFYSMTTKGFELFEIISKLNERLHSILPTGFFCCAILAEIDFEQNSLTFWNGGLPDAYLIKRKSGELLELPSSHLPLGIVENDKYDINIDMMAFEDGDSIFIYSDGVIEAEDDRGEMFGRDNLVLALLNGVSEGKSFDSVSQAIKSHSKGSSQGDDITFLEVRNHFEDQTYSPDEVEQVQVKSGPSDSSINLFLGPQSLKSYNPMPMLFDMLMEIGNLRSYRTPLFTILTELYSNSLEHGILKLSSSLKRSADGFAEYYRLREARLDALKDGYVKIAISHADLADGGMLTIHFEDSGEGFDYKSVENIKDDSKLSGRGYPLIYKLADSVVFDNNGSTVTIKFRWYSTGKPQ
ncbi:fused response regulator/phosphatase [Pleionea sediminis]|uniref:fused response regulator/phosphatase n=1 Tax=Pleionea sediminis TaxID=2569479 RepID=UPI00118555D7|nr:fused response regulator/phosphatase [Pleionea sediminis]